MAQPPVLSFYTSDGLFIGDSTELLTPKPSDAVPSHTETAPTTDHEDTISLCPPKEGAVLVHLYRLFVQLHCPERGGPAEPQNLMNTDAEETNLNHRGRMESDSLFLGGDYEERLGGELRYSDELTFDTYEYRHPQQHLENGESYAAYLCPDEPKSVPMQKHRLNTLLYYLCSPSRVGGRGREGETANHFRAALSNRNRSANGAEELPLRLALAPRPAIGSTQTPAPAHSIEPMEVEDDMINVTQREWEYPTPPLLELQTSTRLLSCTLKTLSTPEMLTGADPRPAKQEAGLREALSATSSPSSFEMRFGAPLIFCCTAVERSG